MDNKQNKESLIKAYFELRDELDVAASKLESMHQSQLSCKAGCDSCCESLRLFPLELAAINYELGHSVTLPPKKWRNTKTSKCRFLINHQCAIYASRPIICRTQGLPLLYENQDGEGYQLSVCHLNFKGVDVNKFYDGNALFMPPFNSRLFLLNEQFVELQQSTKVSSFSRYPLNALDAFIF